MALFVIAVILFVIADLTIRYIAKNVKEKKVQQERQEALKVSLNLDFSREAFVWMMNL